MVLILSMILKKKKKNQRIRVRVNNIFTKYSSSFLLFIIHLSGCYFLTILHASLQIIEIQTSFRL